MAMDSIDRKLLNIIQDSIPLEERPFKVTGKIAGILEDEVISRLKKLKKDGLIRTIAALFDPYAVGFVSTLVALEVKSSDIERAALRIKNNPWISHNYQRDHRLNLWFTLISPHGKDLSNTISEIVKPINPSQILNLPMIKRYKLKFKLNMLDNSQKKRDNLYSHKPGLHPDGITGSPLSTREILVAREIQEDLPMVERPFDDPAERAGLNLNEFFEVVENFLSIGRVRRYAATLNHQRAGFHSNVMVAWEVDEARVDEAGGVMASFQGVSHCYLRPTLPSWPFNLFTMIHGRTKYECETLIKEISRLTNVSNYESLYSIKELKKERVKLF